MSLILLSEASKRTGIPVPVLRQACEWKLVAGAELDRNWRVDDERLLTRDDLTDRLRRALRVQARKIIDAVAVLQNEFEAVAHDAREAGRCRRAVRHAGGNRRRPDAGNLGALTCAVERRGAGLF